MTGIILCGLFDSDAALFGGANADHTMPELSAFARGEKTNQPQDGKPMLCYQMLLHLTFGMGHIQLLYLVASASESPCPVEGLNRYKHYG